MRMDNSKLIFYGVCFGLVLHAPLRVVTVFKPWTWEPELTRGMSHS